MNNSIFKVSSLNKHSSLYVSHVIQFPSLLESNIIILASGTLSEILQFQRIQISNNINPVPVEWLSIPHSIVII